MQAAFNINMLSLLPILYSPVLAGVYIPDPEMYPNLSGRHLTIKVYNNEAQDGLELYWMKSDVYKDANNSDYNTYFPNLSGYHVGVKIYSNAEDELSILSSSFMFLAKVE
jgi:hypothetical protein